MKKSLVWAAAIAAAMFLTGCATTQQPEATQPAMEKPACSTCDTSECKHDKACKESCKEHCKKHCKKKHCKKHCKKHHHKQEMQKDGADQPAPSDQHPNEGQQPAANPQQ
jgi:hypothetical protein